MQSNVSSFSLAIKYNLCVMLLLVNLMFPSELCIYQVKLQTKPNGFLRAR